MLGDAMGLQQPLNNMPQAQGLPPQMQHLSTMPVGSMGVATTLPGQGMAPMRPSYPYPQATEAPPHSVHAQMLQIQTQNRRTDGSTAHVPPSPYVPRDRRTSAHPLHAPKPAPGNLPPGIRGRGNSSSPFLRRTGPPTAQHAPTACPRRCVVRCSIHTGGSDFGPTE